ncbi:hypothetical protein CJF31_00008895 [Rutstroemia sp. NJR-2017a BVV2]|nr:hypothetical protein CJF31_00008895 [Rutstroemia sp. NJR-2017a BVV2]
MELLPVSSTPQKSPITYQPCISKLQNLSFQIVFQDIRHNIMADRLTQLQDAVDELALQFVASLVWVNKHHDLVRVGKNDVVRKETKNSEGAAKVVEDVVLVRAIIAHTVTVDPLPEDQFKDGQLELARDLILKEQQIESLISVLPGLETSEKDQEETIQRLEQELKEEESRRKQALKEKEVVLEKLESVIRSVKRP